MNWEDSKRFGVNAGLFAHLLGQHVQNRRHFVKRAAGLLRRGNPGQAIPALHHFVVQHQETVFKGFQTEAGGVLQQIDENFVVAL
jgi:hypothetical protein